MNCGIYNGMRRSFARQFAYISPGLVFVHEGDAYLNTTEGNAVNISTGEVKYFDPHLVVQLVQVEYRCY